MKKLALKLIVAVHVLWTLLVVASLPFAFMYPQYHKQLLIFLGLTLIFQIPLQKCPFTYLENKLRTGNSYSGTFLHHYLKKLFGIEVSEQTLSAIIIFFFVIVILISVFYLMDFGFMCTGAPIY